jgi:thiamine-phosphate pyrophosphorylase
MTSDTTAEDDFLAAARQDPRPPCQLYLISPPQVDVDSFEDDLRRALQGGPVACLQLRLKAVNDENILRVGEKIKPILAEHDVALIINDRADLAHQLDAEGVHLGQTDGSIAHARTVLGRDKTIGVTCHNSRHLAMEAGDQGADYVAFGAFYPSGTKDPPTFAEPDLLRWWVTLSEIPCVAIGGITVDTAKPLIDAGADFLAVSAGVWAHPQGPTAAVADFNQLFAETIRV